MAEGWHLRNGPALRQFVGDLCTALPEELRACVDLGAAGCSAGATFGMRLPYCPKIDKAGAYVPGSQLWPDTDEDGGRRSFWCL